VYSRERAGRVGRGWSASEERGSGREKELASQSY
jgi:hypothetical protein